MPKDNTTLASSHSRSSLPKTGRDITPASHPAPNDLGSDQNSQSSSALQNGLVLSDNTSQSVISVVDEPVGSTSVLHVVVDLTSDNMHISIFVHGDAVSIVDLSSPLYRNIITQGLSRSILQAVASYGPWRSTYGFQNENDVYTPRDSFLVPLHDGVIQVQTTTTFSETANSSVTITELDPAPLENVSVVPLIVPA